ncbi:MAG: precorrin-3B synthase [Rhizonema sp. PD37]|nr:precorrin-3B synthase [Rhizonema sp. PD37]
MCDQHIYRLFPALHGEGVIPLLPQLVERKVSSDQNILVTESETAEKTLSSVTCPGLFYSTPARDGVLSRIRIPGGIFSSQQANAIAEFADRFGGGYIHITNRANIQIRQVQGIKTDLTILQQAGLTGLREVDHIRNIMASPTAGIDPLELIDTRPLVRELDEYICTHPKLAGLSPKFSVAFDGGGVVSISEQLNDIVFTAVALNGDCEISAGIYFRLKLVAQECNIVIKPEECLPVVAALAQVYLDNVDSNSDRKPRLKHLLQNWGVPHYLEKAQCYLPFSCTKVSFKTTEVNIDTDPFHLDVHPQKQQGLSYIGAVLPLGRLDTQQLRSLANLANAFGSGTLRLTPWQNLLISDIPNQYLTHVQDEIECLGLHCSATHIHGAMVACTGNTGCASSATDTKGQALALAKHLEEHTVLDVPVKIHFTGCPKSCAHHGRSDITLLGEQIEMDAAVLEGYHIYVGYNEQPFGQELYKNVLWAELPTKILQLLQIYKIKRTANNELFGEFADKYPVTQLRKWIDTSDVC